MDSIPTSNGPVSTAPTRVLHVITTISRGGAENHLADLVRGQIDQGYRVTVAYLKGDNYWQAELEHAGAHVVFLDLKRYGDVAPAARLRRLIQAERPTLVHAHLQPAELYCRLALLGLSGRRLPLIVSKHNGSPFYRGVGENLVGRWVSRRANRMIAVSETVRQQVCIETLRYPPDRVSTIYHGIDAEAFQAVSADQRNATRRAWSVAEGDMVFGSISRLVPTKALHILLQGYALHRARATVPSKLVVVGRGPLEADLKAMATALGLDDHVVWAGFREDIPVVLNAIDVFALTSVAEGFGLVLLEAMAARRPVVASAISAIPETVVHQHTGLLIPPSQPEALASAFAVLEEEEVRARMGLAGLERARAMYSMSRMTSATSQLYEASITESQAG